MKALGFPANLLFVSTILFATVVSSSITPPAPPPQRTAATAHPGKQKHGQTRSFLPPFYFRKIEGRDYHEHNHISMHTPSRAKLSTGLSYWFDSRPKDSGARIRLPTRQSNSNHSKTQRKTHARGRVAPLHRVGGVEIKHGDILWGITERLIPSHLRDEHGENQRTRKGNTHDQKRNYSSMPSRLSGGYLNVSTLPRLLFGKFPGTNGLPSAQKRNRLNSMKSRTRVREACGVDSEHEDALWGITERLIPARLRNGHDKKKETSDCNRDRKQKRINDVSRQHCNKGEETNTPTWCLTHMLIPKHLRDDAN